MPQLHHLSNLSHVDPLIVEASSANGRVSRFNALAPVSRKRRYDTAHIVHRAALPNYLISETARRSSTRYPHNRKSTDHRHQRHHGNVSAYQCVSLEMLALASTRTNNAYCYHMVPSPQHEKFILWKRRIKALLRLLHQFQSIIALISNPWPLRQLNPRTVLARMAFCSA